MEIQLLKIESLCQETGELERDQFVERYPGAFLLAMGFLAVQEIRAVRQGSAAGGAPATAAYFFGPSPRHDSEQRHPLSGLAFFLRPTGDRPAVTIGRSQQCDVTVPDNSVSDLHCHIEVDEDGVYVTDLNSTNGTSVNLDRLGSGERRVLADEDILTVGRYSFQLLGAASCHVELALLKALSDRKQ